MGGPWRIELLGRLRVSRGDRVVARFRDSKVVGLLVYLAYHRGTLHPRAALVELLWPECEPKAGRRHLRAALTALRRQLEPEDVPAGSVLRVERAAVQLSPAVITDVSQFLARLEAARAAGAEPLRELEAAVALYGGELLPGCDAEWMLADRRALQEQYRQALRQLAGLCEQAGDLRQALAWTARLVAADPRGEEGQRELIRLQAAASDPVECPGAGPPELAPLRPARPLHGFLPPSFTRFVGRESEIERLCSALGSRRSARGAEILNTGASPTRSGEPDGERPRLLTLTGPGGTGKTRLALEVARRLWESFGGAVWFVSLAGVADASLIADRLLETVHLPRSSGIAPLEQVIEALAGQPSLLVLDNYEHLVTDGAAVVQNLIERVDELTVLVTSRLRLQVASEQEFRVGPLPAPVERGRPGVEDRAKWGLPPLAPFDAALPTVDSPLALLDAYPSVQLFVNSARAADPGFEVTETNTAAVVALCARLEGLPLALELAAARAAVLTPAQMLEQLSHRLDFLVSRKRDAGPHQRSMRATCEWSCHLLSADLQRFFARLSVFRGGCTLAAATAVCQEGGLQSGVALEYLTELLENSLILSETPAGPRQRAAAAAPGTDGAAPEAGVAESLSLFLGTGGACRRVAPEEKRYRLQEIVREYAAEQLTPEDEARAQERHAAYYLEMAERADPELVGAEQVEWLDRLGLEHDNLRAALDWAVASRSVPLGLRLGSALGWFWNARGHRAEGKERLERLLALAAEVTEPRTRLGLAPARARALEQLGILVGWLGDYRKGRSLLEESLTLRRELGDPQAIAHSLLALGHLIHFQGAPAAASGFLKESRAIGREYGFPRITALALQRLGDVAMFQNRYAEARALFEESLRLLRGLGDRRGVSKLLNAIGWVLREEGDLEGARSLYEQSLVIQRELDDRVGIAVCLGHLGEMFCLQGDPDAGRACLRESVPIWREVGEVGGCAWALHALGLAAELKSEYEAARSLYQQSLALRRELGDRWGIGESLHGLGRVALRQGDGERAAGWLRQSLLVFLEQDRKKGIASCLESLAAVLIAPTPAEGGLPDREPAVRAARLYGTAEALREAISAPLPPVDRPEYGRRVAAARAILGEEALAAAWAEGRAAALDNAIQAALEGAP